MTAMDLRTRSVSCSTDSLWAAGAAPAAGFGGGGSSAGTRPDKTNSANDSKPSQRSFTIAIESPLPRSDCAPLLPLRADQFDQVAIRIAHHDQRHTCRQSRRQRDGGFGQGLYAGFFQSGQRGVGIGNKNRQVAVAQLRGDKGVV